MRRLTTALMVVMVLAAVVVVTGRLAGLRTLADRTDSMAPAIHAGDLVVSRDVRADSITTGEIITFPDMAAGGISITHRVVSVSRSGDILVFDTKGDANTGHEVWTATPEATIGRTLTVVPGAGRALDWLSRPLGAATFAGLTVAAIVALLLSGLLRRPLVQKRAAEPAREP